jgi:glycosyltransferase involved in cell wall biosynthesis
VSQIPTVEESARPKALVFSTVFPNELQPVHGLFVLERIRRLASHADIQVVAPVSVRARIGGRRVPSPTEREGLTVHHPTFLYLPGLLKALDGVFLFASVLRTVRTIRRDFDFDLIDAHFTFPEGFAAILLGRWFQRPVVVTIRGTLPDLVPFRLRRAAIRWTLRHVGRLIAVAQPLADLAVALGASTQKMSVIPNGVDTTRFAPLDRREARRRLGLPVDRPLLVAVGRLSPRKGFQRVIRVLPDLLRRHTRLTFAIVGGGAVDEDNRKALERLVAALGLGEHVIFAGARPPDDVALWLNAADVAVLPSDAEGCPNVVLEALACGRPVVATRVGHVDRMVPSFAGVLFTDPEDRAALFEALSEALAREWDEARIRDHASQHTWEGVARSVVIEWRRALAEAARSPAVYAHGPARAISRR